MTYNRLGKEKSPYLKQHANNPVWWYAWGDEAFKAAKRQNKPIFLSIGYSTCYWCHVMEHDSFESVEVAKVLNELFISIKVDREERPDVDRIYMDTLVALTGHGGWPLSSVLTPDLKPFWAGTFFYKQQFIEVLYALSRAWNQDNDKVVESALEITQEIFKVQEECKFKEISRDPIDQAISILSNGFDSKYGGFGNAPKFPPAFQLGLLLRVAKTSTDNQQVKSLMNMLSITLDSIISAGIYDHIGGGFHRYATDQQWRIPHFEKMLYDNAQLCHVLAESYQLTKNSNYLEAAKGCADYVLRDLISKEGAFYAAEDAGEVGKEGEFYVFKYQELKDALSKEDFILLLKIFELTEIGNFEAGTNVLTLRSTYSFNLLKNNNNLKNCLLEYRAKRVRPLCDTKILTSWNALMIRALVKLYEVSLDQKYLIAATDAAKFILNSLWKTTKLYRRYADGEAGINACLEDYSFLVEALLELFSMSGEQSWFESALEIQTAQDRELWNDSLGLYYDSAALELITRKVELTDGATPAGNSVAAKNLVVFGRLTAKPDYIDKARKILLNFSNTFESYPHAACRALQALDLFSSDSIEMILSNASSLDAGVIKKYLSTEYLPNSLQVRIEGATPNHPDLFALLDGKFQDQNTKLFVCSKHSCRPPMSAQELLDRGL